MDNYILLFLAMLEHLELLTKDEATKLAKELTAKGIPSTYVACQTMVKELYEMHKIKPLSKKIDSLK
jgi:hypothetical protein